MTVHLATEADIPALAERIGNRESKVARYLADREHYVLAIGDETACMLRAGGGQIDTILWPRDMPVAQLAETLFTALREAIGRWTDKLDMRIEGRFPRADNEDRGLTASNAWRERFGGVPDVSYDEQADEWVIHSTLRELRDRFFRGG